MIHKVNGKPHSFELNLGFLSLSVSHFTWGPTLFGWAALCEYWWVQAASSTWSCRIRLQSWSTASYSNLRLDPAPPSWPSSTEICPCTFYSCLNPQCKAFSTEHCNDSIRRVTDLVRKIINQYSMSSVIISYRVAILW